MSAYAALYGTGVYGSSYYGVTLLISRVLPIQRRQILVEFSGSARVRPFGVALEAPSDRWTPVTWPGASWDAGNPAGWAISRPALGALTGAAEAILPAVTWVEAYPGSEVVGADGYYTDKVILHTDHEMTAGAAYQLTAGGFHDSHGFVLPTETDDFSGYVLSYIDRDFNLLSLLGSLANRLDSDGTLDLQKLMTALQEVWNRCAEDVDAFFDELCSIDKMRWDVLDSVLYDLGNPFESVYAEVPSYKRKVIWALVAMYREKGTCEGIINAVRLLTGVELLGCSRAWDDTWKLHGGAYPSTTIPTGGPFELGISSRLGPGTSLDIWSFWLYHSSPGSITSDEMAKIATIVDYMKPAGQHFLGITTP